jgi:Ca2+-binding EF-hand superfamily protein
MTAKKSRRTSPLRQKSTLAYTDQKRDRAFVDVTPLFENSVGSTQVSQIRPYNKSTLPNTATPKRQNRHFIDSTPYTSIMRDTQNEAENITICLSTVPEADRAKNMRVSPLRQKASAKKLEPMYSTVGATSRQVLVDYLEQRDQPKLTFVRKEKLREVIHTMEEGYQMKHHKQGYALGPLAEEYIAKVAPKAKKKGYFKLPMKMPTEMEYYEEDVLAETLKEMIELHKDLEQRKNQLALCSDFSIMDFWAIFDIEKKKSFDFREFREVYDLYRIYCPSHFLRMAFVNMDKDLDQKINLKEFVDGMCPVDQNYRDIVINKKQYNDDVDFSRAQAFTPETQRQVVGFLTALVQVEEHLERIRDNLRLRRNFNYKDAFKALDKKKKGYITVEDISDLLTSRYLFCTHKEIALIVPRFDLIKNGQIILKDFIREMRPKTIPAGI